MAEDRFKILAAQGGGFYWHFQAANNEIVCASQVYRTKEAAIRGAYVIKANAAKAQMYDYTGEPA
jgi:uncharacterized protein YegP (UPF0339 family)